jgi:hypothetical protein
MNTSAADRRVLVTAGAAGIGLSIPAGHGAATPLGTWCA